MNTRRVDDLLRRHRTKIDKGIGTAERFAKKRTKGRKDGQIDQAAGKLRRALAR